MRRGASLLFVSVLLLGGCGDDSPDVAVPATTAAPATSSTTPSSPPSSPAPTAGTDTSSPQEQRFCELARSYIEAFTGRAAPGDVRGFGGNLQEARAIVVEMQDLAPPEVVDDVMKVADTLGIVVSAMEEADFDLTEVPPDVLQQLQDPDFQASAARLQAYTDSACPPAGAP